MRVFNLAEELEKERKKNEELEKQLNFKKEYTKYLPKDTEFIILTKPDYDRQQEELQERIDIAINYIERNMIEQLGGEIISYNISQIDVKKLLCILKGDNK